MKSYVSFLPYGTLGWSFNPSKAIDETSAFLKKNSYDIICKFFDDIKNQVTTADKCYYEKILILGFGGAKVDYITDEDYPGYPYNPGSGYGHLEDYGQTVEFGGDQVFYQLHSVLQKPNWKDEDEKMYDGLTNAYNQSSPEAYFEVVKYFDNQEETNLVGKATPLNSGENNFTEVLLHLMMYLKGYRDYSDTDLKFAKISENRNISLVVMSDMKCLSFDSQERDFSLDVSPHWLTLKISSLFY